MKSKIKQQLRKGNLNIFLKWGKIGEGTILKAHSLKISIKYNSYDSDKGKEQKPKVNVMKTGNEM